MQYLWHSQKTQEFTLAKASRHTVFQLLLHVYPNSMSLWTVKIRVPLMNEITRGLGLGLVNMSSISSVLLLILFLSKIYIFFSFSTPTHAFFLCLCSETLLQNASFSSSKSIFSFHFPALLPPLRPSLFLCFCSEILLERIAKTAKIMSYGAYYTIHSTVNHSRTFHL